MAPLLELEGVSKTFGGLLRRRRVAAVRDVSFSLSAGSPEVFTLLGQSGSGKTTLARMILGLETPTAGSLRLEGQDIAELRRGAARAGACWASCSRSSRTPSRPSIPCATSITICC